MTELQIGGEFAGECLPHFSDIFDLKENDRYFCTADIGWITGHSYVVYGLLANGATIFLYEGAPNQPEPDRLWQMIWHLREGNPG